MNRRGGGRGAGAAQNKIRESENGLWFMNNNTNIPGPVATSPVGNQRILVSLSPVGWVTGSREAMGGINHLSPLFTFALPLVFLLGHSHFTYRYSEKLCCGKSDIGGKLFQHRAGNDMGIRKSAT